MNIFNRLSFTKKQRASHASAGREKSVRILGQFNYYINANVKNGPIFQNSNIFLNAFKSAKMMVPIPMRFTWYRLYGKRTYLLNAIKSNTYQLSGIDIGCLIRVPLPQKSHFRSNAPQWTMNSRAKRSSNSDRSSWTPPSE